MLGVFYLWTLKVQFPDGGGNNEFNCNKRLQSRGVFIWLKIKVQSCDAVNTVMKVQKCIIRVGDCPRLAFCAAQSSVVQCYRWAWVSLFDAKVGLRQECVPGTDARWTNERKREVFLLPVRPLVSSDPNAADPAMLSSETSVCLCEPTRGSPSS